MRNTEIVEIEQEPCFAMVNSRCNALRETYCANGSKCNFYKTKEKYRVDLKKAETYNRSHGIVYPKTETDKTQKEFPLTKELLSELFIDKGMTIAEIAEMTGFASNTVRTHLNRHNLRNVKEYIRIDDTEIQSLHRQGWLNRDIAKKLGISASTVSVRLKRLKARKLI